LVSTVLWLDTAAPVPAPLLEPDPGVPPEPTVPDAPPTIPVPEPFAVTSAPFPGTATGSLDAAGAGCDGLEYSPLLAAGGALRSPQPASVTTATAATAAARLILYLRSCIVISVLEVAFRRAPVEWAWPYATTAGPQ
jgi:hypothetical protein